MSVVPQPSLFSWDNVEPSPTIVRLRQILDALPDQKLLSALEAERKNRRNDYPLQQVWRSLVLGGLLGHRVITGLIAELKRNAELRQTAGFDPLLGEKAVPPEWVYSRFFRRLFRHRELLVEIFQELIREIRKDLPELGKNLVVDSKALKAQGSKSKGADMGTKSYDEEGKEVTVVWFGWKLHLLADADFELPLAFQVTQASEADSSRLLPLVEAYEKAQPELRKKAQTLSADKGYDDGRDKAELYDRYGIKPVIPPRNLARVEKRRPLDPNRHDTIYVGPQGEVLCRVDPFHPDEKKAFVPMQYMGFEESRQTHKFRCPAAAFGVECKNREACRCAPRVRDGAYGRVVRVPLEWNRRLFMPLHYQSRTFQKTYRKRTAIERVFSRLDNVHGLETAIVRSREKMEIRVLLSLISMLAMAKGHLDAGRRDRLRSMRLAA